MLMINVVVHDYDVQNLFRDLDRSISGPSLHRFMSDDVADFFRTDIEARFNEEGDLNSGFWPELSDATLNIKRDLPDLRGQPEDINIRTGDLFDFMTGNYDVVSGPNWSQIDIPGDPSDALTAQKLQTAQKGNPSNPIPGFGPTPPRPVLATSEMQLGMILEMLEIHIIQTLIGSIVAA